MILRAGDGKAATGSALPALVYAAVLLILGLLGTVPRPVATIVVRTDQRRGRQGCGGTRPLVISRSQGRGLTLNRMPVRETQLSDALRRQLEFREKKVVFIDLEDEASYGEAVELISLATRAGAEAVVISSPTPFVMLGYYDLAPERAAARGPAGPTRALIRF